MSDIYRKLELMMLVLFVASCTAQPHIARHPEPVDFSKNYLKLDMIPKFNPELPDPYQVDLRSRDLTKLDLSEATRDLLYADFDSKTQWPVYGQMPVDFDWQKIMERSKDPGLGVRTLHEQGFTGKGVGIAIIDQTLLVDHIEYKDRIRVYEEMEDITGGWLEPGMHDAAVASIAVGKTIGIAPDADLYFIASAYCSKGTYETNDFACLAKSIRRIIAINKNLPVDQKIRVLSISVGWGPESKGYEEVMAAVNEAKAANIFVISTSLPLTYGFNFHGLGRSPLSDPNDFWSYRPGLWWQKRFYQKGFSSPTLLVPMDSRTTASPTGTEDYAFHREGGWSWVVPYLAGTYALALQVKPEITPEEFWGTALNTGKTIHIGYGGKDYTFGVILDPQALIQAIK